MDLLFLWDNIKSYIGISQSADILSRLHDDNDDITSHLQENYNPVIMCGILALESLHYGTKD